MFSFGKKPDFAEAFAILSDERASQGKLKKALKGLSCKHNTPHQYMALVYLCALRALVLDGDPFENSFDLLLSFISEHSFFDEINAAVSSPFAFRANERAALRHNYYALSYLAWAYHFGWCAEKNDGKAKELVARARKVGGDMPNIKFNEKIFSEIERCP